MITKGSEVVLTVSCADGYKLVGAKWLNAIEAMLIGNSYGKQASYGNTDIWAKAGLPGLIYRANPENMGAIAYATK